MMHMRTSRRSRILPDIGRSWGLRALWCAMITKTLEPGDPLNNHPNAVQAVMEELEDLRRLGVWDELHPYEAVMVAKLFPDAHLTRVFPIVGTKHFEDPEMQRWKGRIVVSGDRIKTVTGQWAMFQEVGSIPSKMSSCRCILAWPSTRSRRDIISFSQTA